MGLDFSIVRGGPLYRLGRRVGLADGTRGLFQMAAILAAITWLPLLVLNLTRGSLAGSDPTVSFAWSLGTHTRFLAAIPLFFAAEATFDTQTRAALGHLLDAQVVTPAERPRFDRNRSPIWATASRSSGTCARRPSVCTRPSSCSPPRSRRWCPCC